jgi:fructose-bisphosphate aldolase class II
MIVSTKEIFNQCYGKYAVAAVNVWCPEQIHGLFSAAQKANAPFIAQISPFILEHISSSMLISMLTEASRIYHKAKFAIHLDHGTPDYILQCIESNQYNSIRINTSSESFEKNIEITRDIVKRSHARTISVEGYFEGFNNPPVFDKSDNNNNQLSYSDDLEEFVKQTECDSISVGIGNREGAFKYSQNGGIKFKILKDIQKRLPGFPLVMHGGSAINEEDILRINAAGGRLGVDAKGVPSKDIEKAIQHGICKINIATDSQLIWARVYREFFKYNPAQFDPIIPGKNFKDEFEAFCLKKFDLFNSTGKAEGLR